MRLALQAATAAANAVCSQLNNGYIRFYTAPKPATPETALANQVLLAEPRFGQTAFGVAVGGVATANAIIDEDSTPAGGTVAWARLVKADGTTVVADCTVGVGDLNTATDEGFDIEVADVVIDAGRRLGVTNMKYTQPLQTTP